MAVYNGTAGGSPPDGVTTDLNTQQQLEVKPSTVNASNANADIVYSSNTTLTADVYANNVTINSGVTVTTNGYHFYCSGTFTNNGTIDTGYNYAFTYPSSPSPSYSVTNPNTQMNGNGGAGGGGYGLYIQANSIYAGTINANGQNAIVSNAGAGGGGGGGGAVLLAYGSGGYTAGTYNVAGGSGATNSTGSNLADCSGGSGGSTLHMTGGAGGGGGGTTSTEGAGASSGTQTAPTLSNSLIQTWYNNGISNYLNGACGGAGAGSFPGGIAQTSPIQIAPLGKTFSNSYGGAGGGAGGWGNYNNQGGVGTAGTVGQIITYNYTTAPITNGLFDYASSQGVRNFKTFNNYDEASTTSTTATTITSISINPNKTGTILITAYVRVANNTIGDGVTVQLVNGSTVLDDSTITQEGIASNYHDIVLSYTYFNQTLNTPITIALQYMAVTGGTASIIVQSFMAEEVY